LDAPRRGLEGFDPLARAAPDEERPRAAKRRDRVIGVLLGILLGIAVVVIFVFYGSEQTIDAPSIDEDTPPAERSAEPAERR